jgi:hypothetical protein
MLEQKVEAAGSRPVRTCPWQAAAIFRIPFLSFSVPQIEIENVETAGGASRDADKRSWILLPKFTQFFRIARGCLETTGACRPLI